jgi:hypothetical protein
LGFHSHIQYRRQEVGPNPSFLRPWEVGEVREVVPWRAGVSWNNSPASASQQACSLDWTCSDTLK